MELRITKVRVAMAALFVLVGVGVASLLSPLVGTAFATSVRRECLRPLGVGVLRQGRFGRRAENERRREREGRARAPAAAVRRDDHHQYLGGRVEPDRADDGDERTSRMSPSATTSAI